MSLDGIRYTCVLVEPTVIWVQCNGKERRTPMRPVESSLAESWQRASSIIRSLNTSKVSESNTYSLIASLRIHTLLTFSPHPHVNYIVSRRSRIHKAQANAESRATTTRA